MFCEYKNYLQLMLGFLVSGKPDTKKTSHLDNKFALLHQNLSLFLMETLLQHKKEYRVLKIFMSNLHTGTR